jgi:putative transposase
MIQINDRKKYDTDLTNSQWEIIKPLFGNPGNKSKWEKRELVNAVLYLVDSGCKWRQLPHDFPPYTTVSNFYHNAVDKKILDKILELLVKKTRVTANRTEEPSYALIDSQSVKTVYASENRGIDGGKKG